MNTLLKRTIKKTEIVLGCTFAGLSTIAIAKKRDSQYANAPEQKNPMEGKSVIFVENLRDKENADGFRGHLEAIGDSVANNGFYESYGKRVLDIILSFGGLVALSPVFLGTAIAIMIDDPGPVLFTQKRMGKNKRYFKFHKFRSMKMSTPHDVPTHMLDNPDQYITRVGKFLRAHSLDELPQIWDIFIGNMSVIGPRPALWNQDVLTAERDKYGVNEIKPGLTGWAQINGRDELDLSEKARMDGEYVKKESILLDAKCFLGSVHVFRKDDTVVEGGTGELQKNLRKGIPSEDPVTVLGCDLDLIVDKESIKRVLITGAGSYIGESVRQYAEKHYPNLKIDTIDMIDSSWREYDFSPYDCAYHVAGIAHADVGNVSAETKEKYYRVNTDLAIEVANKAKKAGVKQFIFMSSMIVYGESAPYGKEKTITRDTMPNPANFYGDSKWQAEKGLRALDCDTFKVAILRPPMIYGRGSKGNYPTLAKMAKKLPVFPDVNNLRSMLYIDNLCEFVCKLIMTGERGIYFPQNAEYTRTSDMVEMIGSVTSRSVKLMKVFIPAVQIASLIPGKISRLVNKAFGNSCYDQELSTYSFDYRVADLCTSIELTEGMHEKLDSPSFSIITICFNSEKDIRKTIESVLAQSYSGNVEYLIIDGASKDNTVAIAEEYQQRFKEKGYSYRISSEPDKGIYDAMNKGIRKSTGNIIGIINSGDWYESETLNTVAEAYKRTNLDMFYADINKKKKK